MSSIKKEIILGQGYPYVTVGNTIWISEDEDLNQIIFPGKDLFRALRKVEKGKQYLLLLREA